LITFNEDFAIGGHTRLGESDCAFQLEFHSDNLLHPVVPEVSILRGKRRLRIGARNERVDGLVRF